LRGLKRKHPQQEAAAKMAAATREREVAELAMASAIKRDLGTHLKILGEVKEVGIDIWMRELDLIAVSADWLPSLTDLSETPQPARGDETKIQTAQRIGLFSLVFKRIKGMEDVLEGIPTGDGNAALKAVYQSFFRATTGGYHRASQNFHGQKMEGVNIRGYGALITKLAGQFEACGGSPNEKDKLTVLFGGLLPEFKAVKTLLKLRPMAATAEALTGLTFKQAMMELRDFALDEGIEDLTRGGTAEKASTFNIASDALRENSPQFADDLSGSRHGGRGRCFAWSTAEGCTYEDRTGDVCKFQHIGKGKLSRYDPNSPGAGRGGGDRGGRGRDSGRGGKGRDNGRGGGAPPKPHCGYCGAEHYEAVCPIKHKQKEESRPRVHFHSGNDEHEEANIYMLNAQAPAWIFLSHQRHFYQGSGHHRCMD
jgi:hypothetical protein